MNKPTLIDIPKDFTNTGKDTYILNEDYAIIEEVKNILNTQFNSRMFDTYFGTTLYDYLFSNITPGIISIIKKIISEAILSNSKYINKVRSTVTIDNEILNIKLILNTDKNEIETSTRFYLKN